MKKILPAFSLIEMLVVISIFTLISIIILANHSRFNSSVLLGSLAYNIALSVRQAQVYGVSVQSAPNSTGFETGYGMHFTTGTSYVLFADMNKNKRYDDGDSIVKTYSIGRGHTVTGFCGGTTCSPEITSLDVVFIRPNPDANMTDNNGVSYPSATITVSSTVDLTRTVRVASTGQIYVTNP